MVIVDVDSIRDRRTNITRTIYIMYIFQSALLCITYYKLISETMESAEIDTAYITYVVVVLCLAPLSVSNPIIIPFMCEVRHITISPM